MTSKYYPQFSGEFLALVEALKGKRVAVPGPFTTAFPTRVYGLAMKRLFDGDEEGARARLQVAVDWGPLAAFGHIAAEVELTRL